MRIPGWIRRVTAASGLFWLAACDPASAPESSFGFEQKDSAGIEIAHNTGSGFRWLDTDRELRIGEVDGEEAYLLDRVTTLDRREDGALLAPVAFTEVRAWDREGTHLFTVGGAGDGPWEFRFITDVRWVEGGFAVLDAQLSKLVRFDASGAPVEVIGLGETPGAFRIVEGDEGFLIENHLPTDPSATSGRVGRYLQVQTPGGEVVMDRVPVGTGIATGRGVSFPTFDSVASSGIVGPDGYWAASGLGYEIELRGRDGTPQRRITREFERVELGDDAADRYRELMQERYTGTPISPAELDGILSRPPDLPSIPPVDALRSTETGGVWASRQDISDDPLRRQILENPWAGATWDHFDPEGRYTGSIRFPERFSPHRFFDDRVLGIARDEYDVEYVEVHRVERRE